MQVHCRMARILLNNTAACDREKGYGSENTYN